MGNYHTMKEAGYEYHSYVPGEGHVLHNLETGEYETWFANKNHASYGIIYKNTHLEFAHEFVDEIN